MRCIHSQYPFRAVLSHRKQHQQMKTAKILFWLSTNDHHHPARRSFTQLGHPAQKRNNNILSPKALLTSSLVLGVTSSSSGDAMVLLQTTLVYYSILYFFLHHLIAVEVQTESSNVIQLFNNEISNHVLPGSQCRASLCVLDCQFCRAGVHLEGSPI